MFFSGGLCGVVDGGQETGDPNLVELSKTQPGFAFFASGVPSPVSTPLSPEQLLALFPEFRGKDSCESG